MNCSKILAMAFAVAVLFMTTPSMADTWISGEVALQKAYEVIEVPRDALEVRYRPAGINIPDGQQTWSTEVINGPESNNPRVRVRLEVDGTLIQSWIVGFVRKRTILCYVTPQDIIPGKLIDVSQLELKERFWTGQGAPVTEKELLLGKQSRCFVPAGSVLMKKDLILRPVIARGERVLVNLKQDSLTMSFEGKAKTPGYPGRLMPVTTPAGTTVDVWVDYNGKVHPLEDS